MTVQTPAELFDPDTDVAPGDAWDLQVVAPPAYIAWLDQQARRGPGPHITAALAPFEVAMAQAVATIAAALPEVPLTPRYHAQVAWSRGVHPHLHVFLAAHDLHGRPVARDQVVDAGASAWVAQLDRLVDATDADPSLGITWTRDGIAGVNHSRVQDHTCSGLYGPRNAVLACP